jgi:HlyD family secretion protein
MAGPTRELFRKQSLERLSSPERLDHLMQVVSPLDWLPLGVLAFVLGMVSIWSVFGRVPIEVVGRGALIYPPHLRGVAPVEEFVAPAPGQIVEVLVTRGDWVKKGEVLCVLAQPDIRKQLDLQRQKLAQLESQNTISSRVLQEKADLERLNLEAQNQTIRDRIRNAERGGQVMLGKQLEAVRNQRRALFRRLQDAYRLTTNLEASLEKRKVLRARGLVTENALLDSENAYVTARSQMSELDSRIRDLEAREAELQKAVADNRAQVSELQAQQRELAVKRKAAGLEVLQAETARENEMSEVKRQIAALTSQLGVQSRVYAKADGRALEVNALLGQVVTAGSRLGTIEVAAPSLPSGAAQRHIAVGYFTVGEGKRIRPGMRARLTPDLVKREEFGGIVARVTRVSEFPVSAESAHNLVNNADLARSLTEGGRAIEVFFALEGDPRTNTGYRWSSSQGPAEKLLGTHTASVRVSVEHRAPITFAVPLLRSLSGLN